MRHTQFVNYTLYQIGWFAGVLSATWHRPWTGFLVATILVGVPVALSEERSLEVRLIVLATAVGAIVEMIQIAAGTYAFTSGVVTNALPPHWLLAMWAQFATTFRFSLQGVITRPVPAMLFGAAGGPIAFRGRAPGRDHSAAAAHVRSASPLHRLGDRTRGLLRGRAPGHAGTGRELPS